MEEVAMKKYFLMTFLLVFVILSVGCVSDKTEEEATSMGIYLEQVEKITVSTQMTNPKQDIVLENKDREDCVNKLNEYSLKQTNDEQKNGWQYLFKIEQEGGVVNLVSFMDDRVTVDGTVYEVEGYDSRDFLYLFE
ncbi:hypothetical protein HMPREF0389_01623 [Filifactor alocis ATCC 35896]|uniref:Lipoprotein n=2 Tax=Filifactor TaxID=44259 RepID=D6GU33_FILAD|nr:hypothetical protein HMPREF0389_01623 [Filifactor alocis ATCC 35896]